MKILMVVDHKIPTDIRIQNEAESLVEAGFDVGILAIGEFERTLDVEYDGYVIHQVAVSEFYRKKMHGLAGMIPWMDWFITMQVSRILERSEYNAIHFHDLYTFGAVKHLKRKYDLHYIGDMHENYVEVIKDYEWPNKFPNNLVVSQQKWERKEREWLPQMDRVITVSQGILDRIISKGVDSEKAFIVPNYLRLDLFDRFIADESVLKKYNDTFTLLYVGGFVKNRGLEHVLTGMNTLKTMIPKVKLVLVGDGEMMGSLKKFVSENGLEDMVDFEGWKKQSEIKSYLMAADIGLIPFKKTPQTDNSSSNKLFQYMYFNLPIVATNCDSVQALVEKEQCGVVYQQENSKQFAETVIQLFNNPAERKEKGKKGKSAVEERYNWKAATDRMITMYRELKESKH